MWNYGEFKNANGFLTRATAGLQIGSKKVQKWKFSE
jgi:hypothetical protein